MENPDSWPPAVKAIEVAMTKHAAEASDPESCGKSVYMTIYDALVEQGFLKEGDNFSVPPNRSNEVNAGRSIELSFVPEVIALTYSYISDNRVANSLSDQEISRAVWTPFWHSRLTHDVAYYIDLTYTGSESDEVVEKALKDMVKQIVELHAEENSRWECSISKWKRWTIQLISREPVLVPAK